MSNVNEHRRLIHYNVLFNEADLDVGHYGALQ